MLFASSIGEAHKRLVGITAASVSGSNSTITTATALEKMSRKTRLQTEVCGDCGASDPAWASINRGILLCSDCCSVHRSLGRHISIVKSLRQGTWEPSVLNFVNSLNAHGANSVWEHHLLDAAGSSSGSAKNASRLRKPTPKDALHPTKSDFIKAKHVNLAFVLKPNLQDSDEVNAAGGGIHNMEQELSKQLHASVRTSNLETSLRLLVQGADPNFFHEEKRSTPLHVAAKFGQASQIEMLIVYGANINAIDGVGQTPLEVAKANNHNTIAERLLDAMYDVTDRITMFLGGKKPDHASGRHLIIPQSSEMEINEQLKIARGRLQLVPNKMFEELVMDLYDEVDRRECEAIWSTSTINADNAAVPFLPANPFLSATRNQGRQKLARFSRAEFAGLLTDVLIDARRRQNMANLRPMDASSNAFYNPTNNTFNSSEHDPNLSDDEPIYDPVASDDDYAPVSPMAQQPIKLAQSHLEMETLRKQISEYMSEINQLKNVVQKLSTENTELKSKFTHAPAMSAYDEPLRIDSLEHEQEPRSLPDGVGVGLSIVAATPAGSTSTSASSSATNSNQSTIKRPASMYERRAISNLSKSVAENNRTATSMYQMALDKPIADDIKRCTDLITRRLKELIIIMQDVGNKDAMVPCAERISSAVMELIKMLTTPATYAESLVDTLKMLSRYNLLLQHECENLQKSYETEDSELIEKNVLEVRNCAYYIASATKALVVQFE